MRRALWHIRLAMMIAVTSLSAAGPASAQSAADMLNSLPDAHQPYPLRVRDIEIDQALKLFAKNLRIGLELKDGVTGTVNADLPASLTRQTYLEELAAEHDFVWYFDGQILRVSPIGDVETKVIPLRDNTGAEAIRILQNLGIYQSKFIHRSDDRSRTFMVSGPSDYVALVESAAKAVETSTRTDITLLRGNEGSTPAALQALQSATGNAEQTAATASPEK